MPTLPFKKQFAPMVEDGTKRQTIRKWKKQRPVKRGDRLHLFTGMRTKFCRRLRAQYEDYCTLAVNISIFEDRIKYEEFVSGPDKEDVARADGFANFAEMVAWFKKTHGLPLKDAQLIRW